MHRVMGQVQEERAVLVLLDERDRLVGQAISKVFPIFSIRERVPTRKRMFRSHAPLAIIREEIVARVAHVVPAHIEIETLMLRIKLPIPANMPLAHGSRDIPGILECLGNRDLFQGQILFVDCLKQRKRFFNPLRSLDWNRMGNVQTPRVFAGEDAYPRWRTHAAGRISIGKLHALLRQLVNVWGFVVLASVTSQVGPTHIVNEDEDDVEFARN